MQLTINNLNLQKKKKVIFKDASLDLSFNKLHLIGKNGSGKTSILNEIYHGNKHIRISTDSTTYVNQKLILLNNLNILENIELLAVNKEQVINQYLNIFKELELSMKVKKLSGGQKQVLNILIALNQQAELILIDEPFNNLDYQNRVIITNLFKESTQKIIIISHGNNFDFCDKLVEIKDWKLNEIN